MNLESKNKTILDLTFEEFKLLVDGHELPLDKNNLLSEIFKVPKQGNSKKLAAKGLLDKKGDFHNALTAICNPDFVVNSIIIFNGMATTSSYFSKSSNSTMIAGCWPVNDKKIRISYPLEPEDIISNSLTALAVNDSMASSSDIAEKEFSIEGLTAFATAVDAVRTALLISILERQQISSFKFPKSFLDETLKAGREDKNRDSRWLLTLCRTLFPVYNSAFEKITASGLNELTKHEIIELNEDHWIPSRELIKIASSWLQPLPAAYIETSILNGVKSKKTTSLTLRGSGPICLFEFNEADKDNIKINFRSLDNNSYWLELMGRVIPDRVEYKMLNFCPECGTKREVKASFCGQCGADLKENK